MDCILIPGCFCIINHPTCRFIQDKNSIQCATTVYALPAAVGVTPLRDPMNADPAFRRVAVRHDVLPRLSALAGRDLVPVLEKAGHPDLRRGEPGFPGLDTASLRTAGGRPGIAEPVTDVVEQPEVELPEVATAAAEDAASVS